MCSGRKVAGDSAGIAIPFAAGVAGASFLIHYCIQSEQGLYAAGAVAYLGAAAVLAYLMTQGTRVKSALSALVAVLMFLAGMTCFFTSASALPMDGNPCFLFRTAEAAASRMSGVVDSIPYKDEDVRALVKAMTLGDRSGLSYGIKSAFRGSGASHLLALSGMHLGLIYLMLSKLLSLAGNSPAVRKTRSAAIMAAAVFYTIMTGASPSITRACIFILLSETSNILLRQRSSVHILCMSLMIQLTFSPQSISDIGFQLSYLAVTGIVVIFPWMRRIWPDEPSGYFPIMKKIWDSVTLSLSCQLMTAPLAWYIFGSFPLYFMLTNLLAIPVATLMMFLSIIVIAAAAIGICPEFLVTANEFVVHSLIYILDTIASLPNAAIG